MAEPGMGKKSKPDKLAGWLQGRRAVTSAQFARVRLCHANRANWKTLKT